MIEITGFTKCGGPLTKRISLGADGTLAMTVAVHHGEGCGQKGASARPARLRPAPRQHDATRTQSVLARYGVICPTRWRSQQRVASKPSTARLHHTSSLAPTVHHLPPRTTCTRVA